ncbi:hypothetical protein K7X08_023068 [Anisodus acutangulus]|uniref:Late blight resistance protein R1A-like N-terminal domain-containing protein n=1 Tax=Anisodus acutangulus TaxID=402998 RepID=A0A9Q1RHB6_9SOLA|nr:hypothetical protein K7X08_023068 [Anisodus acutangulus]
MSSLVSVELHGCLLSLQRIENEHDMTGAQKDRIKAIKTEVWFLETFFEWKEKQNFKKKYKALQKHINPLMQSIVDDLLMLCGKDVLTGHFDPITSDVLKKIWLFKLEIRAYYSYPEIPSSVFPPTHEFVVKYIDNVVQNLKDLVIVRLGDLGDSFIQVKDQMEVMEKELTLLKNFVCFLGTMYSPELQSCWKAFLSHAKVVATNASIVYFLYLPDPNEETSSLALEITTNSFLKTIEPIEPCVHHIYTDVLRNLRLLGSPPMSSRKLVSLSTSFRIILNELPLINNIEEEMSIRFFTRLENVAIDAGLLVYSLYDSSKDKEDQNQGRFVLADTVQLVKTQVDRDIWVWLQSHLPKNDTLGSTNILLETLKELLCCNSDSIASVKNQLERVHEELGFIQILLNGAERQGNNDEL